MVKSCGFSTSLESRLCSNRLVLQELCNVRGFLEQSTSDVSAFRSVTYHELCLSAGVAPFSSEHVFKCLVELGSFLICHLTYSPHES